MGSEELDDRSRLQIKNKSVPLFMMMPKVSFSDGLALAGIIAAIVLLVLDKAGKMRGVMLLVALGVAALMTLPLALNNSWVLNASSEMEKFSRGMLMFFVVGGIYSCLAVWVSADNVDGHVQSVPPQVDERRRIQSIIEQLTTFAGEAQAIESQCLQGDRASIERFNEWNVRFMDYLRNNGERVNSVRSDNQAMVPLRPPIARLANDPELQNTAWWLYAKQWYIEQFIREYRERLD